MIIHIISTIGCSGAGKTNSLFNSINHQPHVHKSYLFAKDPYESKEFQLTNEKVQT